MGPHTPTPDLPVWYSTSQWSGPVPRLWKQVEVVSLKWSASFWTSETVGEAAEVSHMSFNAPVEDSCGWGAARARVKRKEERVMKYFMVVGVWKKKVIVNVGIAMASCMVCRFYVVDSRALYIGTQKLTGST